MSIDRCVCFNVTFAELKRHVELHGGGMSEICRAFGCGRGCALCVPWIERMLETGETSFEWKPDEPAGDANKQA